MRFLSLAWFFCKCLGSRVLGNLNPHGRVVRLPGLTPRRLTEQRKGLSVLGCGFGVGEICIAKNFTLTKL